MRNMVFFPKDPVKSPLTVKTGLLSVSGTGAV